MATQWVVAQEHLLTDEAGNVTAIASDAPALQHPAYTTVWIVMLLPRCRKGWIPRPIHCGIEPVPNVDCVRRVCKARACIPPRLPKNVLRGARPVIPCCALGPGTCYHGNKQEEMGKPCSCTGPARRAPLLPQVRRRQARPRIPLLHVQEV